MATSLNIVETKGSEDLNTTRTKAHDFNLDKERQIQRKIVDADKALLKVENNEDDIKIRPNSGTFKVISEEVLKLEVGQEIRGNEAVAIVIDKYQQTDKSNIPFMVKTSFSVTDLKTGLAAKAVLHTYISKTFFMVQGNSVMINKVLSKDFFFNTVLKPFMANIMKLKGKEITFVNQFLTNKVIPIPTWKRKMPSKSNQCDVCSRIFVNEHGVNVHKKNMHGIDTQKKKKSGKLLTVIKSIETISRSDSLSSISDL